MVVDVIREKIYDREFALLAGKAGESNTDRCVAPDDRERVLMPPLGGVRGDIDRSVAGAKTKTHERSPI